jgi:uncharacterized protein YbcI
VIAALQPASVAGLQRSLNADLARALVQVHVAHVGRGPTKAQAFYRGDVVVVVLRDVLTKPERTVAERGRPEAARAIRGTYLEVMRPDLVHVVETLTGCRVTAFMCDSHIDTETTALMFVLDRPVPGAPEAPAQGTPLGRRANLV